MNRKVLLTVIALAAVLCVTPFVGSAQAITWQTSTASGTSATFTWTGVLAGSMATSQLWKVTGSLGSTVITMSIVWNPVRQTGVVYDYTVVAPNMQSFRGWSGWIRLFAGEIVYWVGGYVPGTYMPASYLLNAFVKGYHEGVWTPTDPQNPFAAASSVFDFYENWRYYTNP